MTPYEQGYAAALVPEYTECPFAEGSEQCTQWYDGFGDGTDDFIFNKDAPQ